MIKRFHNNKTGLSAVVTTLLLVALSMVAVGIVWLAVNNLVRSSISNSESCVNIIGKVSIDNRYTCYNSSSNELQFSINIGDLDVSSVMVGISGQGSGKGINISNKTSQIPGLVTYPGRSINVRLPSKNAGLTYIYNLTYAGISGAPDSISLAPIINGNQCTTSDTLNQIDNCALLA